MVPPVYLPSASAPLKMVHLHSFVCSQYFEFLLQSTLLFSCLVRACHLCFYMVCMEGFVTSQFAVNLVACCVLVNLLFNLLISLNNNSKLKRRMQHFWFCFVYFSFERKFCTIVTIINRFVQCSKVLNLEVLDTSEVLYRSVQTI